MIVVFSKKNLFLAIYKYIKYPKGYKWNVSFNIILYFLIFLFDEALFFFKIFLPRNKEKSLIVNKKKNLYDWFIHILNIFKYYRKYNIYLWNFKWFNCAVYNILISINNPIINEYIAKIMSDEYNYLIFKWLSLGVWGIFASLLIKKKYKEKHFGFKKPKYNESLYTWFKLYYKYGLNYNHYRRVKMFFLWNKYLNKKYIISYNWKLQAFIKNANIYYDLLIEDNNIINNKNNDYNNTLFNLFIKSKLESPFLDEDISFTYFFFNKDVDKEKLAAYSHLASYSFLYNQLKIGVLTGVTKEELLNNYQQSIKTSVCTSDYNDPYIVPPQSLLKFNEINNFDFTEIFNDLNKFKIKDLEDILKKAFIAINNSESMLCANIDNDINIEYDNKNDFNKSKNDLSLLIWLNNTAMNDNDFKTFLTDLKLKYPKVSNYILDIDLFNNRILNEFDLLELFLKKNFFYLDYFSLAIHDNKYSLCYLLFIYKVLKNIHEYKIYYNQYSNNIITKYNKVNYKYHKFISDKFQALSNSLNYYIKYKADMVVYNNFNSLGSFKNFNKRQRQVIKTNKKWNYQNFLYHFEKYESYTNFNKKHIKESNVLTFDQFVYSNTDLNELKAAIAIKKKEVENWSKYYIFKNNELENFYDTGFYLHYIKEFEWADEDYNLFNDSKEFLMFNYGDNYDKIKFQYHYSSLYFHYLMKIFKDRKHYVYNVSIDNLLFQETEYTKYFDTSENYSEFLYYLKNFLKGFKSLIYHKRTYTAGFINYLSLHYAYFLDNIQKFDFNILYDSSRNLSESQLKIMEKALDDIMQIWKHCLERIEITRKYYVNAINLLRIDKFCEFLDYPMFQNHKGFVLLKEAYYIILSEFIKEERMFDHAYHITMCVYRVYERHNKFFRSQSLFKNGVFAKLDYLDIEDFDSVFNLEKDDPLLFIKLYNSKQNNLNSELWKPSISFNDILEALSSVNEKDIVYDELDESWIIFFNQYRERDLIIYDLTIDHIQEVTGFIIDYNNAGFNQLDIEVSLNLFLENNLLKYENNMFKKYFYTKKTKKSDDPPAISEIEFILKKLSINDIKDIKDSEKKFMIFQEDEVVVNKLFLTYLKSKINSFYNSNFKNYLLELYDILKYNYNQNNHLYYLVKFYENVLKLNNIDKSFSDNINDNILYDSFNYLESNKMFQLNYVPLIFQQIKNKKKQWNKVLSKWFNNKNLFAYLKGRDKLFYIYNILDNLDYVPQLNNQMGFFVDYELPYLSNLSNYILKCNYNFNIIYDFDNTIMYSTFNALFDFLNIHILKTNYMLNKLIFIKDIINDIYLNFCTLNTNNIKIIQKLYSLLYKDKNNKKYMQLINLLLYVKDPIYLYNILTVDLKCYVNILLKIFDIIQISDFDENDYNSIIELLMLNDTNDPGDKFLKDLKIQNFLSKEKILDLNKNVSDLTQYAGYFNLDIFHPNINKESYLNDFCFVKDNNILTILNINKLLIDFNDLFVINNKDLIKMYNTPEFLLFGEYNNFKDFNNIKNYTELLYYITIQNYKYRFLFENQSKPEKRKSAPQNLIKKKKIKKESKGSDDNNSYVNIDNEKVKKKVGLMTNIIIELRQWNSDLEYKKAYTECKNLFDKVLLDFHHPIWDEFRAQFLNEQHFLNYVLQFTEEHKNIMFDNYWDFTIKNIQKTREEKESKRLESRWFRLLKSINKSEDKINKIDKVNEDIFDFFCYNLEKNKKWKEQWFNDLYFLNKPLKKDSNWKIQQSWNASYNSKIDIGDVIEDNQFLKKTKKKKLWNRLDWWKKW